jgi:hypothetical protein
MFPEMCLLARCWQSSCIRGVAIGRLSAYFYFQLKFISKPADILIIDPIITETRKLTTCKEASMQINGTQASVQMQPVVKQAAKEAPSAEEIKESPAQKVVETQTQKAAAPSATAGKEVNLLA